MKSTYKKVTFFNFAMIILLLTACTPIQATPPVAVIQPMTEVSLGSAILLDGSASYDAANHPLTYHWELIGKPVISKVSLPKATDAKNTFIPDVGGEYIVTLYVNNSFKNSEKVMLIIHVTGPAYTGDPVAVTAMSFATPLAEPFTLDGSGSKPSYDLKYAWTFVSKPENSKAEIQNADSMIATCNPDKFGAYICKLTVTNSVGMSDVASICIEVVNYVNDSRVEEITYDSALILWYTLGKSTSIVEYQAEGGELERVELPELENYHRIRLKELKPDTQYTFTVRSVDPLGNEVVGEQGTFQTGYKYIDLDYYINKIVYNEQNHKAYAMDYLYRQICVIDLPTFSFEEPIYLNQVPDDIVLCKDRQSLFVVNRGSTFITEVSLVTKQVVRNIYWPVCAYGFRLYYANQHLYVVDHKSTLWSMDLNGQNGFQHQILFQSVKGMAFTNDQQKVYVWYQEEQVQTISRYTTPTGAVDQWVLDQKETFQSTYNTANYDPDAFFLKEEKNLLLIDNLVVQMNDLMEVHRFSEKIFAVSPVDNIAVGKEYFYNLNDFSKTTNFPIYWARLFFFVPNGDLYTYGYGLFHHLPLSKLQGSR
jgi:DNA-binding beta-propeller fold protein YncE